MRLRSSKNTKDRLREHNSLEPALDSITTEPPSESLVFRTHHPTKPCYVDLTCFERGREHATRGGKRRWLGAYSGRPELIRELLPALIDRLTSLSEKTARHYTEALTSWWRVLDDVESRGGEQFRVTSAAHLSDVHRQVAMNKGVPRKHFALLLTVINPTRNALGLKALHWALPPSTASNRLLVPKADFEVVRRKLKRKWFDILDRWDRAETMVGRSTQTDSGACFDEPTYVDRSGRDNQDQERLRMNYVHFQRVVALTGDGRPSAEALYQGLTSSRFSVLGYSVREMLNGFYPNGDDIRVAFHLCLATTGWNPAVLLNLDVNLSFIEPHPMDSNRYVMRGVKDRAGGAEQIHEGLFKSQSNAGGILQTLIKRTEPLRAHLRVKLEECLRQREGQMDSKSEKEQMQLDRRVMELQKALRSPWIFASTATQGDLVARLTDTSYASSSNAVAGSYMQVLVAEINQALPAERQIGNIRSTDFRDGYAYDIYHASGGSILAVYKALGHKSIKSTSVYVRNTLLKDEHRKLFGTFNHALWTELEGKAVVDPTIIAKWSRDGPVSEQDRVRLSTYRALMITRLGTGCKDPYNPPKHIAPTFTADGVTMCHVQRCTLCPDHVIIMPESMPGLCKRLAELRHLKSRMSVGLFIQSTGLGAEIENTEMALAGFEVVDVNAQILEWTRRIECGEHRVIELDGA